MWFNSIHYVVFLFCVCILLWSFKKREYQHSLLLIASYYFYFSSSGFLLFLIIYSSLLDFYCGKEIYEASGQERKKFFLILSLVGNLGMLCLFKYADFLIYHFNYLSEFFGFSPLPFFYLALPVGISFYTFQTLSYTIDIYRGELKPTNSFGQFALYVAFFPQLVAGPIVRAADFLPQLNKKISVTYKNFKFGLTLIGFGMTKKVVFADNIATFVNSIFSDPTKYGSLIIILATIGFGVQIYCDFSAYTDIAVGSAKILGFHFKKNFNKPYFARNPSDFWKRWHISLSSWLKDYLYIPLGGNRKGKARMYVNLMITMVLGGLWHGASLNFVIWGGSRVYYCSSTDFFLTYLNLGYLQLFQ